MCGIAGLIDIDGLDPALTEARTRAAIKRIGCRGPDDRGKWTDRHCTLVHTRLAIIDLSPLGAQPMQRNGLVITYNGEIFNYAELRDELAGLGHRFRSNSDTEVILAGWRLWGEGLLRRMVGMFAFAIWDTRARTLLRRATALARSRFCTRPQVVAWPSVRILSPARPCWGRPVRSTRLRYGHCSRCGSFRSRHHCYRRAQAAGGSLAAVRRKRSRGRALVRLGAGAAAAASDHIAAVLGLRQRFDAAVAARLVADVPVGVFLSSGVDSSLVAASVAASGAKLKTFTVGFADAANYYEERPLAAAVARHLGAEHTEIAVSANRASDVLDRVFIALDEPFANLRRFRPILVSEETRRKVSVVLTGDGADEVFGGYRRYWSELYIGAWHRLPQSLRSLMRRLITALPEDRRHTILEDVRRARRFVDTADADPARRQAGWMRLMS